MSKMYWLIIGISGVTCGGKTTLAHSLREFLLSQQNQTIWKAGYKIGEVDLISQDDYFLPVTDSRHENVTRINAINFELLTAIDMKQMLGDIVWTMKNKYRKTPASIMSVQTEPKSQNDQTLHQQSNRNQQQRHCPNNVTKKQRHFSNKQQQQQQQQKQKQRQHKHQQLQQELEQKQQQQQLELEQKQQQLGITNLLESANVDGDEKMCVENGSDQKINILIIEGFIIFNHSVILNLCDIKFHFHLPYEKCFERRSKRTYDPPDVVGYFELCVWPHYERNLAEYRDRSDITYLNGETERERIFKYALTKLFAYFNEHTIESCLCKVNTLQKTPSINLNSHHRRHD